MRDAERERGRDTGRGKSRLHAGGPMWDSILGLDPGTPGPCPGLKAGRRSTAETPRRPTHIHIL